MPTIDILYGKESLNINYVDRGSGKTVVILHGWGTNVDVYASIVNALCPFFRVVVFDMPGFGKSTEPKDAFGVEDYANCALLIFEKLNISEAFLIGHSHGGRVAIQLAAQKNNGFNVQKIILLDSAGVIGKKSLKTEIKIKIYKAGKAILGCAAVKKLFPGALEKFKKGKGSADYNAASEVMKKSLVKCVNTDMTPLMPQITVPTLLVFGSNDTATPVAHAKIMEKLISDSGLVVIEGAGHYSFLDNVPLFNAVMYSFFEVKQ